MQKKSINKGNIDSRLGKETHGIVRGTMEGRKKMFGKGMLPDISYLVETYTTVHVPRASQDCRNLSQIGDTTEAIECFSDTRG